MEPRRLGVGLCWGRLSIIRFRGLGFVPAIEQRMQPALRGTAQEAFRY